MPQKLCMPRQAKYLNEIHNTNKVIKSTLTGFQSHRSTAPRDLKTDKSEGWTKGQDQTEDPCKQDNFFTIHFEFPNGWSGRGHQRIHSLLTASKFIFEWKNKLTAKPKLYKTTNKRSLQPHGKLPNNGSYYDSKEALTPDLGRSLCCPTRGGRLPRCLHGTEWRCHPSLHPLSAHATGILRPLPGVSWERRLMLLYPKDDCWGSDRTSSHVKGAMGQSLHSLRASVWCLCCTAEKQEGSWDELSWIQLAQNTVTVQVTRKQWLKLK